MSNRYSFNFKNILKLNKKIFYNSFLFFMVTVEILKTYKYNMNYQPLNGKNKKG